VQTSIFLYYLSKKLLGESGGVLSIFWRAGEKQATLCCVFSFNPKLKYEHFQNFLEK